MRPNLLILGGTTEATALCQQLAKRGVDGIVSFAGRVERPVRQPLPQRVGGFGGAEGLAAYLRAEGITHLVDATHPFAAGISANAVAAAEAAGIPLVALTRPPWAPGDDDDWIEVPDIAEAVEELDGSRRRVMLAVGRTHLDAFAVHPQHFYLLRLVDPPVQAPPFPDCHVEVSRGPFTAGGDRALMERHGIQMVVAKNSGGDGARAKLDAARALDLPVVMIERPYMPPRPEVQTPAAVLDWLQAHGADLGE